MTLTQGLLLLAAVVLAVLAGHGLWLTWRARPRRAGSISRTEPRVGARIEPTLEGSGPGGSIESGAVSSPSSPSSSGTGTGTMTASASSGAGMPSPSGVAAVAGLGSGVRLRPASPIDALIDAVAEIALEAPVSGDAVLAAMPPTRRAGSKPMFIEGLHAETGQWEPVQAGQRYGAVQAAVQLANRGGALNEIEYSEFVQKTQRFADALGGVPDFADMTETVARARELDDFARTHDAQLAVRICARSTAWTVAYLAQMARRQGAVEGLLAGTLVVMGDEPDAPPLMTITFDAQAALAEDPDAAALRECTITLDVPQSPESAEPFPRWQQVAGDLARDLDGVMVDDGGQAVGLHQFAGIHRELQRLYSALASRELAAGSPAARRLFS